MAYISYRFIANGNIWWGLMLLSVTIVLAYFLYLNFVYYFLSKTSKIDITPWIYKVLHIKPKETQERSGMQYRDIPANGLFDARKTMPATMISTPVEQQFITTLAQEMIQNKLLTTDYGGLGERGLNNLLKKSKKPVYAIGKGALVPYFSMKHLNNDYVIYAGINEAEAQSVGKIKTVGLQPISQINQQKFVLYLAAAYLTGGTYKMMGRNGIMTDSKNYQIELRIAYQKK